MDDLPMDADRLRRLSPFAELDHHDLSTLSRWLRDVTFAPGEAIFEQGALPYELFVIEQGSADVIRDGETVATVGPGDVVGEMGPLQLRRRWATVVATTEVRAVALRAEDLAEMAAQMPEVADRFREIMAGRETENGS